MGTGEVSQVAVAVSSGVVGLVVGSFLNVVVYRLPRHLSIARPPSHCPTCETELGPLDLVPVVSWLALRGRCRHCGAAISPRYPLVELATGLAFAGMAVALGSVAPLASVLVVVACAVAASVMDADGAIVPAAVLTVAVLAALSLAALPAALAHPDRIVWAAVGAALAGLSARATDRVAGAGRWRRTVLLTTVGWAAGWLWAGGGPLVAAWVVVATALSAAGTNRRAPLAVLAAGGYCMMVAGAALARS